MTHAKGEPYYGYTPDDDDEGPDESDVQEFHELSEKEWNELDEEDQEALITDYIFSKEMDNAANQAEEREFWNN